MIDLQQTGSNLVSFSNEVWFTKDSADEYYYYVIAKDYDWSFVALQVKSAS